MAETEYPEGAVKKDPSTGLLAMRSMFDGEKAWRVFRFDNAPHFVAQSDVEAWTDLVPAPATGA